MLGREPDGERGRKKNREDQRRKGWGSVNEEEGFVRAKVNMAKI